MPSFQALLPCALRSEVESCLWLGYPRRSKFLYLLLHDLEFWDSHDHPSFPPLTPKFLQFVVPSAKYSHCINLGRVLESTVQSKKSLLHKIPWLVSGGLFPANPLFSICFTIKEISKSEAAIIHYLQFFLPLHPLHYQESCIFLSLLQIIHSVQLLEECWDAHYNPNIHCCTQFRAIFFNTKKLVLCVCTFLEEGMSSPAVFHD